MAPKRRKLPEVDLTHDESEEDNEEYEPPAKRRRASSKRTKTSATSAEAGTPAHGSAAEPAAPKARGRKTGAEPQEKRVNEAGYTVTFRPKASQDVKTRIERAMPGSAHRMFLLETRQQAGAGAPGGPAAEFHVLGATGNVYQVRISRHPACTCPDFAKGNLCKHILFVMLRVLRRPPDDPVIWQRALLTSEAEQLLAPLLGGAAAAGAGPSAGVGAAAAVDRSVLASDLLRQRYAAIAGGGGAGAGGSQGAGGGGVQRPIEGDCPICYEEMVPPAGGGAGGKAEAITFCASCGNNMHKECFARWAASKRSSGTGVTCVYCRAPWQGSGGAGGAGPGTPGASAASYGDREYVNLSQYSGGGQPSLEELYGANAYWVLANAGQIGRRQAARMHAAARGWV